ncbi:MAG: hypothetical protein DRI69_00605 [Bacteroidetes bacterium]|nr:MAG: hypothetical protein DRI69_00605 [Bacteroidota bacterium]
MWAWIPTDVYILIGEIDLMKRILFFLLCAVLTHAAIAQPVNDVCLDAVLISSGDLDDDNGSCQATQPGTTVDATPWDVAGANYIGNCWNGADTLNVVFFPFQAQGVSASIEVLNGPDDYYITVVEFNAGACDGTNATEWGCGDNAPIVFDNDLTIGNTYYVIVAFANNTPGSFDLCVFNPEPADNDECLGAMPLPDIDGNCNTVPLENYYYPSSEANVPACFGTATQSVWFKFTAQGVSIADLHIEGAPDVANVAVWDFAGVAGCDLAAGTLMTCQNDVDVNNPITMDNLLVIGQEYYIEVTFDNDAIGPFDVCLDAPEPAFNDDCMSAVEYPVLELSEEDNCLTSIGVETLNNDWPSTDLGFPPCWDPNATFSVWFWFVAQGPDVDIEVTSTFGSDEQIAVVEFAGGNICDGPSAGVLECTVGEDLEIDDELEIGNIYYVVVGFDDNDIGDYCINIFNPMPPDNDTACAAIPLETNGSCNANAGPACINDCFTTEYANPDDSPTPNGVTPDCMPFIENTVWFTMQLADPNNVGFDIIIEEGTGQNLGAIIGLLDDCTGQFDPKAFYCSVPDTIKFGPVDETETYYIIVGTQEVDEGTFSICIDEIEPCFDNNFCEDPLGISSANDMGELITVSPDGTGNCAGNGDPFACVEGCNVFADDVEVNTNCLGNNDPVVWYTFTTDDNAAIANIIMTSDDIDAPAFQLFLALDGTCGDLQPIGNCTTGSGGEASLTGQDVGAGQIYYIAVGGILTVGGDFELCISILENLSSCTLDADVTVTNRSFDGSLEGPFFPTEVVSVCMNVNTYTSSGNNCQWIQGVIPTFGNGWDPSSFDGDGMPIGATLNGSAFPAPGISGGTTWEWFGDVTYHHDNCFYNVGDFDGNGTLDICNALYDDECTGPGLTGGSTGPCWQDTPGNPLPYGWFAYGINGLCATPGHPTVDYGDGTCCSCNMGPWNFCFDLTVRPYPECQEDETTMDLSLGFVTVADGEVGSWNGGPSVCANDEPVDVRLPGCCVELVYLFDEHDPICSGGLFNWLIDQPDIDFWEWTNDASVVTGATDGEGANLSIILDNLVNPGASTEFVTYTILGFDGGECPAVIWEVTVEIFPEITLELEPFRACATPTNPYILIPTVSGGDGTYSYEWQDGSTDPTLSIDMPQANLFYTLTVTDATGCSATTKILLDVYETFEVDIDASLLEICAVEGDIDLNASADGGIAAYTFEWTSPMGNNQSGPSIQVDETGQWNVLVTDNEGCMGADSVSLEFFESPDISVDPVSICLNNPNTQQIIAIVENGQAPYEYFWMTPSQEFTTSFIVVNEIGNYSVTVTDFNGCTAVEAFQVEERESPNVVLPPDIIKCEADLIQGVDIEVDDDFSFIQWNWSTSETGPTINITDVGTYTVTVTNDGGCTSSASVSVSVYDPIPDLFVDTVWICPGGTSDINGDPNYSYEWNFTSTGSFYLATQEGVIFVLITDINGCTREEEIEVVESANLPVVFIADTVICSGTPVEISINPYPIANWYSNTELTDFIASGTMITATDAGLYFIEVSDGNGCFGKDSIQIYESDPVADINGTQAICDGESSTLDVGTWTSIEWSTGETTSTITTDTAGTFTVTVTDALNCTAVSAPFVLTEEAAPEPLITGATSFCPGTSSTLDAGGPYDNYLWSTGETSQTIDVNATSTITVIVTSALGCRGYDTILVKLLDPPTPQILGDNVICNNVAVALDASGPGYVSYLWSSGQASAGIQPDTAGTFIVTVTDANGCTGTDQIVVQAGNPMPVINGLDEACQGEIETLTADAGFAKYEWSTSEVTSTIDVNATGIYDVTVTDALGCTGVASFDFAINPNPVPNINGSTSFCVGGFTNLDAGPGFTDYLWSDGQTVQAVSISVEGAVSVTVTDTNGCTGIASVMITENTFLTLNIQDTAICEGEVVELVVGNFDTYKWFDGSTAPTFIASAGGSYAVTVTDAFGCSGDTVIVVTEFAEPFATVKNTSEACNTSVGGVISIVDFSTLVTGGDQGGSWKDVDNSGATGVFPKLDFTGVVPGDYQFEYTTSSAQGPCKDQTYPVTITVWDCVCPSPLIDPPADICADAGMLDLETLFNDSTLLGGVWAIINVPTGSNPATLSGSVFNATGADPGVYDIQYTISGIPANCNDNNVQQILVNAPADAGLAGEPAQVCAAEDTIVALTDLIIGAESGGLWIETSSTMSQTGFDAGTGTFDTELEMPGTYTFEYILQGTTPCPDVSTTIEVVIEDVPLADAGSDREITCDAPSADLDGSGSSQGGSFEYNWRLNGAIVSSGSMNLNVSDAGTYELEVINTSTGCKSFDDVDVSINGDIPVLITNLFLPVCEGDGPATVSVASISGGTAPYTYTLNGTDANEIGSFSDLPAGDYTLVVVDANGCSDRFEFTVNPTTSVDGQIAGETVIDQGDDFVLSLNLIKGVADSIVWTDADGNPLCVQCDSIRIEAITAMDVFVTIYDENGCHITLSVSLFVKIVREVYVPNVFTPDGDGINDYVTVYAPVGTVIRKFEVFSRWGEKVFASDPDIPVNIEELGWDGRFAGDEMQPGVFVFHAQVRYPGDTVDEIVKGDITLIR